MGGVGEILHSTPPLRISDGIALGPLLVDVWITALPDCRGKHPKTFIAAHFYQLKLT